ncbi:MAG: hypothetical protein KC620_16995 [Myxococcales bacterium]|nr:hypothetical protein [Myxococcales bacterium]
MAMVAHSPARGKTLAPRSGRFGAKLTSTLNWHVMSFGRDRCSGTVRCTQEERLRGSRGLGATLGRVTAALLGGTLTAQAQEAGAAADTAGGSSLGIVFVVVLLVVAAGVVLALPRLLPLNGRLIVRDAFGPSVFASTSLSVHRGWRSEGEIDAVPSREGLLVALKVQRGLGRDVQVTLLFDKSGQRREVLAGRLGPGRHEQVNDLVIDYDDGRSPQAAV